MKTIAIVAEKGGVGKTTLATHLAVHAQAEGRRTVIVDLDPQASARKWGVIPSLYDRNLSERRGPGGSKLEDAGFAGGGFSSSGLGIRSRKAGVGLVAALKGSPRQAVGPKCFLLVEQKEIRQSPSCSIDLALDGPDCYVRNLRRDFVAEA